MRGKSVAAAESKTVSITVTAGRKNLARRDGNSITIERLFG
jgi:hypothetical protein